MTEGTSFLTETYDESTLSSEETVLKRFCQEVDDEQSRRDRELFDFLEDLVNSEEFLKKTQNKVERSAQVTPSLDRREEDEKLTEIDYRLTEYFKNRHAAEELKRIKEECQKNRKIRKCQEEAIRIIKDHIFRSAQIHACHLQERISRKLEKPDFQRKMAEYVVASRKIKRHQKIGRAKREMSIINKLAMEQRRWEKIKAMQNKTYDYKVRRREKIIPDMEIIGIPVTLVERPTVREIEEKPSEEPLIEEIIKEPETPIKEPKKKGKEKKKGKDKSKKPEKKAKKSEKKPKKEKKAKKDKKKGKKKGEPVDLVIPDVPTTNPRLKIVPGDPECMVDIIRKHEELLMVIDERKSLDEMMDEKELTYERDRASYWRPNLVLFEDFENGRVYKKKVTIVNGGKVSKKIKLHAAIIEDGFDPSWINVDNFGIVLLIPGLSFHVTVTFQPRQLTRVTYGKLIFTSYEANENRYGQFAVPIKCTPFTAEIIVAPANVDFGTVPFWKVKTLKPKFLRIVSTDKQPYRVTIRKVVNESELEDISNSLDSENVEEILQQIVDYCHQTFRFSRYSAGLDPNSGFQLKIVPLNFDHLGNYWERYECQFYRDIGDGTRLAGCKECFVSAEITGHFIGVRPEILDYGVCAFGSVYQVAFEVHNADCSSHRVLVQFPSSLKSYLSSNLAEFFIPSRASRDVSLKFMPRKDMLDGFPSFYDPDTNILNFPVKVAVTTKHCADVPPVKLTIFAILNDNSGLSVRPLNLEYAKRNGDDFYLDLGDCMLKETVHAKIGITNSTAAEQHFGFLDLPQCVRISPNYGFGTLSPYESKQLKVLFSPDYLDVPRDKIDGLRFPLTFRISVTTLKSIGAIKKPFDHRKLRRSFDRMLALLRRKDDVLEKEMEEVVRVLRNSKEIVDRYVCESFDYVNRDGGMGMLEIEGYEGRGDAPPSDDDQHLRNINSNKIWLAANIIEMPVTFSHQFVVFPDTPCGSFSTVTIQLKTKKFLSDNRCLCGYGDAKPSTSQDFEIHFRMTGNDAQVTVEPICGDLASGKCLDLHLIARPEVPKEIVEDKARYLKMVEIREEKLKAVLLKREKEREARSLKEQQMMAKKKKSDKSAKKTKEKKGKKGKNVETKQEVPEEREEEPLPEITVDPQEVQINYFDLYPAEMVVWRDFTPRVLEADFVCEITYRGKNINQEPHVLYLKAICNVVSPHFTHNLDRQHLDFGAAAIGSSKRKMLELQNIREVSIRPRTSLLSPVGFFSCPGANDVAVPPEHVLKLPVTFKPNGEQEVIEYLDIKCGQTTCSLMLTGRGVEPSLTFKPDFLICRLEAPVGSSAELTVEIENHCEAEVNIVFDNILELEGIMKVVPKPVEVGAKKKDKKEDKKNKKGKSSASSKSSKEKKKANEKVVKFSNDLTEDEIYSISNFYKKRDGKSYFKVEEENLEINASGRRQVKLCFGIFKEENEETNKGKKSKKDKDKKGKGSKEGKGKKKKTGKLSDDKYYVAKYNVLLGGCTFIKDFIIIGNFC